VINLRSCAKIVGDRGEVRLADRSGVVAGGRCARDAVAGLTLGQSGLGGPARRADDEITFPVARHFAAFDLFSPVINRGHPEDPGTRRCFAPAWFAALGHGAQSDVNLASSPFGDM
jgi:hypothetical protein